MSNLPVFLRFSNNSAHTRGFTWAASIRPRSVVVERFCRRCGAVESIPAGAFDVVVEGGVKYPDILGCGAYPFLIVSERVIRVWQEAGISCFHTFPVGIAEVRSKKLKDIKLPTYFRVEIDGRCEIDLPASGAEVIKICPDCHHLETHPMVLPGFQMVPGTWDGCPLFRDAELYPRVNFCTWQMMVAACQSTLTNFRFDPMQGPVDNASRGIDYRRICHPSRRRVARG